MMTKKYTIFFFIVLTAFFNNAGIINSVSDSNFLTTPEEGFVDSNTIVAWQFSNTSSGGNETGQSGTGQGGSLVLTQNGTISGAVNTSPFTGYQDDGYYRGPLNASSQYFSANQTFINGDESAWTIELYYYNTTNSGQRIIIGSNNVSSSVNGFLILKQATGAVYFQVSSGGSIVNAQTTNTMSTGQWYHIILQRDKSGAGFEAGFSSTVMTSSSDWDSVAAGNKITPVTDSSNFSPTVNYPYLGVNNSVDNYWDDATYQMVRISNIARY